MSSKIIISLPVPTYLKKVLTVQYGEDYTAKPTQMLGLTILGALQLKRKLVNKSVQMHKRYTDYFHVYVTLDNARRQGFELQQFRVIQIARSIERQIRRDLYISAIFNKDKYNIDYLITLNDFLDTYDISEEELSYESLRKDFNRFLYNPKNQEFIKKICG